MEPTQKRLDELIDAHGGIHAAIASREACVRRRAGEGKESPVAAAEVAALRALPPGYATPAQQARTVLPWDCC